MFTLRRLVLLTPVLLLIPVASCVLSTVENNASRDNIYPPRTRAELTDYRETSSYKDVMKFINTALMVKSQLDILGCLGMTPTNPAAFAEIPEESG